MLSNSDISRIATALANEKKRVDTNSSFRLQVHLLSSGCLSSFRVTRFSQKSVPLVASNGTTQTERQLLYSELITKVHDTALADSLIPPTDRASTAEGSKANLPQSLSKWAEQFHVPLLAVSSEGVEEY
uniref:Uncharacterized protein n=1 Tax=Plectus sambesii TaxID=2011161 RepID=A0A914VJ91_9BILA